MSSQFDQKQLEALADEPAKEIHTEDDLTALSCYLLKLTVERALQAELDDHLGYKKHDPQGRNSGNNRNGYSAKTLKSDAGAVEVSIPRDCNSTFGPKLIRSGIGYTQITTHAFGLILQ